jgi:hypothetical protein
MPTSSSLEYEFRLGDLKSEVKKKGRKLGKGSGNGRGGSPTHRKQRDEWGTRLCLPVSTNTPLPPSRLKILRTKDLAGRSAAKY